jgi:cation transport ATPase
MRFVVLLAMAAGLAPAQLIEVELQYRDTGCASCVESLQRRLSRMRGVEEAVVSTNEVKLRLAEGNSVRLQQVRAFVEQGGNRVESARVKAKGAAEERGGKWLLAAGPQHLELDLEATGELVGRLAQAAAVTVDGEMVEFAPGGPLPPVRVRDLRIVQPK